MPYSAHAFAFHCRTLRSDAQLCAAIASPVAGLAPAPRQRCTLQSAARRPLQTCCCQAAERCAPVFQLGLNPSCSSHDTAYSIADGRARPCLYTLKTSTFLI